MLNGATLIAALVLLFGTTRLVKRNRQILPRVGRAGPIGYAWTVLRSVLDSDGLVEEGWSKFGGKPFILPSMSGEWIVLGPDNVELLRRSDDSVFNAPIRAKQLFQPNVMFGDITTNPYHLETIIRSDLTKALRSLVPEMLEEAQLAIPEHLKMTGSTTSVSIPVFPTMVHLVARVSNRAMIGAPGCRNEKFLNKQVSVAEEVIPMSQILNWFPVFLRPVIWKLFCVTVGAKDGAVRLVSPYVQARIEYAQQDNPSTITDLLLRYAPEEDIKDVAKLAVRVVHLNMAAIHTSGIFTTHALFELARMPANQVEEIRAEIVAAIDSEGGVTNKAAVGKFYLLDSLLKEIGRFHSLFAVGSSRVTLREAVIADGTVLPAGSVVAFAPKPLHHNPDVYHDPYKFDPFRFAKLRKGDKDNAAHDIQQSFTHLSNEYIVFGLGKHGCPGRFFAALKIKVILAELLLSYDIAFPEGASRTPKPFAFNIFTVPNPTAQLVFTKRKV
ncbi:cytochrome P450 [Mycena olivaceomarginata]|nr:cytochrome P450 [Mycena olivaceomarginata]